MIVWKITGNEIGPNGNGARFFAKKKDAESALRDYRAERLTSAKARARTRSRSRTAMTSCGFCTTQWATGVRPDLAAHWADHPAAPVAEIDKPSRCRHQQAERNLSHRDVVHAVVEATRNWMVIYDWLDDICDDVVLAHPLKVKAIADAKIKTDNDRRDGAGAFAAGRSCAASLGAEPRSAGTAPGAARADVLRAAAHHGEEPGRHHLRPLSGTDGSAQEACRSVRQGRAQAIGGVTLSPIDRIQIDRGLAFIDDINARIKQSEATIRAMTKQTANVKLLKTIPGIGEFFGRLICRRAASAPDGETRNFNSACSSEALWDRSSQR